MRIFSGFSRILASLLVFQISVGPVVLAQTPDARPKIQLAPVQPENWAQRFNEQLEALFDFYELNESPRVLTKSGPSAWTRSLVSGHGGPGGTLFLKPRDSSILPSEFYYRVALAGAGDRSDNGLVVRMSVHSARQAVPDVEPTTYTDFDLSGDLLVDPMEQAHTKIRKILQEQKGFLVGLRTLSRLNQSAEEVVKRQREEGQERALLYFGTFICVVVANAILSIEPDLLRNRGFTGPSKVAHIILVAVSILLLLGVERVGHSFDARGSLPHLRDLNENFHPFTSHPNLSISDANTALEVHLIKMANHTANHTFEILLPLFAIVLGAAIPLFHGKHPTYAAVVLATGLVSWLTYRQLSSEEPRPLTAAQLREEINAEVDRILAPVATK